jgi:hypothetical protein
VQRQHVAVDSAVECLRRRRRREVADECELRQVLRIDEHGPAALVAERVAHAVYEAVARVGDLPPLAVLVRHRYDTRAGVLDQDLERKLEVVLLVAREGPARGDVVDRADRGQAAGQQRRRVLCIDPHNEPVAERRRSPRAPRDGHARAVVGGLHRRRRRRAGVLLDVRRIAASAPNREVDPEGRLLACSIAQVAGQRVRTLAERAGRVDDLRARDDRRDGG